MGSLCNSLFVEELVKPHKNGMARCIDFYLFSLREILSDDFLSLKA